MNDVSAGENGVLRQAADLQRIPGHHEELQGPVVSVPALPCQHILARRFISQTTSVELILVNSRNQTFIITCLLETLVFARCFCILRNRFPCPSLPFPCRINTPGVIERVKNLFRGYNKLILGFNTFLPEGEGAWLLLLHFSRTDAPRLAFLLFASFGRNLAVFLSLLLTLLLLRSSSIRV